LRQRSVDVLCTTHHALAALMFGPTKAGAQGYESNFAQSLGEHFGLPTVGQAGSFMDFKAAHIWCPGHRLSLRSLCNNAPPNPQEISLKVAEVSLGRYSAATSHDP
jgi:hypothetical protein